MKYLFIIAALSVITVRVTAQIKKDTADRVFNLHPVVLDGEGKLLSWITPADKAYDQFLRWRWSFIKTKVPNSPGPAPRSDYPQYYFYAAFKDSANLILPDMWMNDVGEKIPNWMESARLFYAYSGDSSVMKLMKDFLDYSMDHGRSPASFSWPEFPYTTTNAGDTLYRGFTSSGRFGLHEIQVDHAADIGLAYLRMFFYCGEEKYKTAAVSVANTLAAKVRKGDASRSPWPYLVNLETGKVVSEYGANWIGAYTLLSTLVDEKIGNVGAYSAARSLVKSFLLQFPLRTGYWSDGHTDFNNLSNTYKSNMSASNFTLYLLDHPEFDANHKQNIPALIKWTEDNFILRSAPGEPSSQWGANIVGEQDSFLFKMDYQTARYAAECAKWFALTGDSKYKDKAFRSLNWVTYCVDSAGKALESPLSPGILSWWSDCYGEGPRMFYQAFAAIPQWAPLHENHILYSESVLKKVSYGNRTVGYAASERTGKEFIKLSFKPGNITLNGLPLTPRADGLKQGYILRPLGDGDFSLVIYRRQSGKIVIR